MCLTRRVSKPPPFRLGLYTSPHLVAVRERIRINAVPLSEEQFSSFFFEVWDRLGKNQEVGCSREQLLCSR